MFCAVELLLPGGRQIRCTFNGLYKPEVVQDPHLHKVALTEHRGGIDIDCKTYTAAELIGRHSARAETLFKKMTTRIDQNIVKYMSIPRRAPIVKGTPTRAQAEHLPIKGMQRIEINP